MAGVALPSSTLVATALAISSAASASDVQTYNVSLPERQAIRALPVRPFYSGFPEQDFGALAITAATSPGSYSTGEQATRVVERCMKIEAARLVLEHAFD